MRYLSLFLLMFFVGTITATAQTTDPFPPSPTPDRVVLTWSDNPATTQSVTWRTDVSIKMAYAEIAKAMPNADFRDSVDRVKAVTTTLSTNQNVAKFHSVTFTDLEPNTLYAYRVAGDGFYSEWFQFSTAEDQEAPFSFIYFGDAQNDIKSLWSRCIRQAFMTMPDVDFFLHAGDLVNRANNDVEWGEWFYAGGWLYGTKSHLATPGNHEYARNPDNRDQRTLSDHWRPTFTFPENGPEGLEESVYYLDYQGSRIISLNTTATYGDSTKLASQKIWLEEVLKKNKEKWTIVTHHHPIYSTSLGRDNEKIRQAFQPIYEKYGVDIVLQGHDHTYGRGHNLNFGGNKKNDQGPMYVVSVSGPKMYELGLDEWLERAASNTQLYQIIEVMGNQLVYKAYTTSGELYDAFELNKQSNGVNLFVDRANEAMGERLELPGRALKGMPENEIQAYRERLEAYKARQQKK